MHRAWFLIGFLGSACLVPTFEVEQTPAEGDAGKGAVIPKAGNSVGGAAGSGGGGAASQGGSSSPTSGGSASAGGDEGDPVPVGGAPNGTRPYLVGYSTFNDSASGMDHNAGSKIDATFAKPAGTAVGDFMLVFFGCDHRLRIDDDGMLASRGWTMLDAHEEQGTDGQGTYLLYRIVDGTEPDPIVITDINNPEYTNGVQGLLSVYRRVDTDEPINAYETALVDEGSTTSRHVETPTPPITTSKDDCLLLAGLSPDTATDAPEISSWPEGFDDHQISVKNPKNPYPLGWANIYTAERPLPQAGVVPSSFFGWEIKADEPKYYGALSFIIALAPAPE